MAMHGVDVVLSPSSSKPQSLYSEPITVEALYTINANSLLDFNRAKEEIVVEMSPIHVLVSDKIILDLAMIDLSLYQQLTSRKQINERENEQLPPRLEVLSNFMQLSMDFSISGVRISFLPPLEKNRNATIESTKRVLTSIMTDFLDVVSAYDLIFPHEGALDATMQVCIDKLVGLGLSIEDAWEATNLLLLNFLEEVADQQRKEVEPVNPIDLWEYDLKIKLSTIERAVKTTFLHCLEILEHEYFEPRQLVSDLDVDFPGGLELSYMSLFYDQHLSVNVPSLFVVNGDGLHLLRLAPHVIDPDEISHDSVSNLSDNLARSAVTSVCHQSAQCGITFHMFSLDKKYRFGKGGLPLAILGTDSSVVDPEVRIREQLSDFDIGDFEFLFSRPTIDDSIGSAVRIFAPLVKLWDLSHTNGVDRIQTQSTMKDIFYLAKTSSATFLFLSDNLHPFMRLSVTDFVAKSEQTMSDFDGQSKNALTSRFTSQSISLTNLTHEGELFPDVISVLQTHTTNCFTATIGPVTGVDMVFQGLRLVFLKQFLNEFLQYFINGEYGFGCLLRQYTANSIKPESNNHPEVRRMLSLLDMSIILPRSSYCYDAMCMEVNKISVMLGTTAKSFSMPSKVAPLNCEDFSCLDVQSSSDLEDVTSGTIARIRICVVGFRIFSSLPDKVQSDLTTRDSPAFRSAFAIDGRAAVGKRIFIPILSSEKLADSAFNASLKCEKAQRCWCEITTSESSLEIVVDHNPHLRLLVTDYANGTFNEGLNLDVRLSQFCLLLSIWFSNMQELPQLFPYTMVQLQLGAHPVEVLKSVPEYGSEAFRSLLKNSASLTSEVGIVLQKLSLRCTFDDEIVPEEPGSSKGLNIRFNDAVIHVTSDRNGIARIGVGSASASLTDESLVFSSVLSFLDVEPSHNAWADLGFGLDRIDALPRAFSQAFQLSIVMTPDWHIFNLGLDAPQVTLSDFSPIFKFLKFVSTYFSDARFANPSLEAIEQLKQIKNDLRKHGEGSHDQSSGSDVVKTASLDFRLWLSKPVLSIPCDPLERNGPGLRIDGDNVVWYKYMTSGALSSQECVSDCLHLTFQRNFLSQRDNLAYGHAEKRLIDNLSFGFRADTNSASNHNDICVQIPFDGASACDIASPLIHLSPVIFESPKICSPYEKMTRVLGPNVCEITCVVDVLPLTLSTLLSLIAVDEGDSNTDSNTFKKRDCEDDRDGFVDVTDGVTKADSSCHESTMLTTTSPLGEGKQTFSLVASLGDIRMFVLDPLLGPYLPIAVMSVSLLSLTTSQFASERTVLHMLPDDIPAEDLQVSVSSVAWADYFKLGLTRSWEPLIEAYQFRCDYEKSRHRGSGLAMNSDSCLHINVSSALLVILEEVLEDFYGIIKQTFSVGLTPTNETNKMQLSRTYDRRTLSDSYFGNDVLHQWSEPVQIEDRVAFLLQNMTGHKMRIIRPTDRSSKVPKTTYVTYLSDKEATDLTFPPSISMVKNLNVTEVAYPGLRNGKHNVHGDISRHAIDLQIPGFQWLEGIEVDTFGRKFAKIVPQSAEVKSKIDNDWRLANMMQLLVEVGLRNGGRQITVRSIISVTNKTTHGLGLLFNTDDVFKRHEINYGVSNKFPKQWSLQMREDYAISPGESLQVPALLLESSLRLPGSHLGYMWIKPSVDTVGATLLYSSTVEKLHKASDVAIDFSSKPVHFSKLVNETSYLFETARFHDLASDRAKTKLQLSCPVVLHAGDRMAPFCYAVEIDRSPIVHSREKSEEDKKHFHAPVVYSLIVHPPIVITNFLPEKGRFELMHAVNRTVLWSGDLQPGQQESVHSVGLDAPLLLLLNLGFAKTPVGEGALVHHGSDLPPSVRGK
jgi:hypothetical protein